MNSSSIFDWTKLIAENTWLYGGAFILVLSVLVFIHEWGHYIVARMCGVKIDTFSIGFGKELFGITDKNGTRWKVAMIPLGGYVKMFGDVDPASSGHTDGVKDEVTQTVRPMTEAEKAGAFYAKPVGQRAAIVVAGPAINYLFAIIVLAGLFVFVGQPVTPPRAAAIMEGSAAAKYGFEPHDEVVAIDGKKVSRFEDVRRNVMVGLDLEREFTVLRNGKTIEIKAVPDRKEEEDHFGFKHTRGLLGLISPGNAIDIQRITAVNGKSFEKGDVEGVRAALLKKMDTTFKIELDRGPEKDLIIIHPLADLNKPLTDSTSPDYNHLVVANLIGETYLKYNVFGGLKEAVLETWDITTSTIAALGQMITGTRSATELGGIIRIGAIAGDM
ncbi:MAG TPA: RIP metalloprotease RseP, partial [Alphaproteobacteria bacterium]